MVKVKFGDSSYMAIYQGLWADIFFDSPKNASKTGPKRLVPSPGSITASRMSALDISVMSAFLRVNSTSHGGPRSR